MKGIYEYMPEEYKAYPGLYAEMQDFYNLLEVYQEDKTENNKAFLRKALNDLLFSIKHRVVEGSLTSYEAEKMGSYVKGLIHD